MDLKLVQRFLPYAAIAIITTLSLWSRRSQRRTAKSGRSNDSEDGEAKASSLPSSSPPLVKEDGFQYDVFLSFRGPDTRKTFADLLYEALEDKGIITFIDSEKLEKGQKLDELFERIQRSKIFVPIFSPGYADSKWCLKEIAKMVECKRVILPLFVDVEPRDVRRQTGPFGSAFSKHRRNKEIDEVEMSEWSNALKEAGGVSGYTTTNSHLGKLIQQIVKRILSEVNKTSKLVEAQHPVGLHSRILDVIKVMEKTEALGDVRMVGIYGMGGIGKTTLSTAVYNEISARFDARSFISNVREAAERPSGLVSLQKQLLGDVFNDKDVTISSTSDGLGQIKKRIGAKKVLLVLDDVSDASQINELVGQLAWFRKGSRIIITTRDTRVLTSARVKKEHMYELKGLDDIQSLELFSWHAFGKKEPDAKFADLSNEVASTTAGLPLALTIFGSHFFDLKTVELWNAELDKLKEDLHENIYDRLRISFDVLDKNEKEVFLDIACFFVGQNTKPAILMWKACRLFPESAINCLIHKSLVSINDEGKFEMHDHVRDMGRKIVQAKAEESRKHSRLWKDDETADVLQNKRGTENVEAIQIFCEEKDSVYLDVENLAHMSQLRMLLVQDVTLKGGYEHFPRKLILLKWSSQTLKEFPSSPKMRVKVFNQLKALDLSYCVTLSICPDFASMIHLEMLSFNGCKELSELHPSIGLLKCLTHLFLSGCRSLKELPQEVWQLTKLEECHLQECLNITTLPSLKQHLLGELKVLNLCHCRNLTKCPDFMGMPHLEMLYFEYCEKMSELHQSIGHLKSLTNLNLKDCKSLKEVPQQVWQLTSLRELDLSDCTQIAALPSRIQNAESLMLLLLERLDLSNCSNLIRCPDFTSMPHLQRLAFSRCKKMTKLDPSIFQLKRLMHLDLTKCSSLKELPQEIGQLTSLRSLDLSECSSLKEVPQEVWQLTSLQELGLYGCKKITAWPSQIGNAESLQQPYKLERLNMSYFSNLMRCPDFTSMPHLQELDFGGYEKITELDPSIGKLKKLAKLDLSDCESLKELPQEIGQLTSLKHLMLEGCSSLKEVPQEVWQLTSLQELNLRSCTQITALPSRIQNDESLKPLLLERLVLSNCSNLIRCPDFTSMPHLLRLSLKGCEKMTELDASIGQLKRLTELDLRDCKSLKELPQEIAQLTSLESLDLSGCSSLEELHPSVGQLKRLVHLDLSYCKSLKELPQEIGQLTSLEQLTLEGCSSLEEVPQQVWQLTSLPRLNLSGCTQITALLPPIWNAESLKLPLFKSLGLTYCMELKRCPDFTSIPHLETLSFDRCEKLTQLDPSIGLLKSLTFLDLKDCKSLKRLPQEIGELTSLERLTLTGCSSLKEVPREIGQLASLRSLDLSECSSLREVPQEVWQLTSLQSLYFDGCIQITALPSQVQNTESSKQPLLETLSLSNCSGLIRCPDLTSMPHLNCLYFSGCKKMTELDPSIGQLKRLINLDLKDCKSLKELPQEIGQLTSLEQLTLTDCSSLKEVPSLPPSLEKLKALRCHQLEILADVSNLKGLQDLSLSGCIRLEDVPGIEQLTCLMTLRLGGCRRLADSLFRRVQEANFQNLFGFSIPGRLINDGSSNPQLITFILPKGLRCGLLCLHVDERSQQNMGSAVVRIDITTDNAQISFPTFFKGWNLFGEFPNAAFEWNKKLKTMSDQGRFKENVVDYAQGRGMVEMRVSIDGFVLLHGDLWTPEWTATDEDRNEDNDELSSWKSCAW